MQHEDYRRIERAIGYLQAHSRDQPSLDEVAAAVHLSKYHFQRLFKRFTGLSPKRYLQYLTLASARTLLPAHSVLDTAYEVGLSAPSRLHDLFVTYEAVTPGEFKQRGAGMRVRYGFHPSPFGEVLLALSERGVCGLSFVTEGGREAALAELQRRWAGATLQAAPLETAATVASIFGRRRSAQPVHVHVLLQGTSFQLKVWEALLELPAGKVFYEDIARRIGHPTARRAVGQALGANPVAVLIPCHRVVSKLGGPGGYRYGTERKLALLAWEAERAARQAG